MPGRPAKPCSYPGCRALVRDGTARCEKHTEKAWARSEPPPERIRGRKLQAMRESLFKRQPLCEECERGGVVTVATIRDHRIPLAEGGADDQTNEQALCVPCHDVKSQAERVRGKTHQTGARRG